MLERGKMRGDIEMVDTESLVPSGHLLRQVDASDGKINGISAVSIFLFWVLFGTSPDRTLFDGLEPYGPYLYSRTPVLSTAWYASEKSN